MKQQTELSGFEEKNFVCSFCQTPLPNVPEEGTSRYEHCDSRSSSVNHRLSQWYRDLMVGTRPEETNTKP